MNGLRCLALAGLMSAGTWSLAAGEAPAHVTSASCAECHQEAYDAWADSHHGWAWRPATPDNVLGDFDDATYEHRGVRSRFFTQEGRFHVETAGPLGQQEVWQIAGTVGVTPLQQYLVALDDGRLQALDVVWDTERKRWYHLYPEQALERDPGLHWTGPYRNWNSRCVSCHVTGFEKGYEPKSNRYDSTWSEMGVGCEACHGPGEAHVDWARQPGPMSLASFAGVDDKGLTVDFAGQDRQAEMQVCASCHSRRESLGADSPPPGEPFDDHFRLTLLREGLYFADGQIEDEVYVYGSFLQSKMHARGVSCGDCHEPHGGGLVADIDAVCTQCHNPQGNAEFPTLRPASYVSPLHHRHRAGTETASCVSCHMPERTYMGTDDRRDHSFRVPRPDLSVELGVPNACNGCHADQSAVWAQKQVAEWFPEGHHLRPHYGEVLHAAREELNTSSVEGLVDLAMDRAQPAIVRATAVEMLAPVVTPQIAGIALPLLEDESPLLRSAAIGLFHSAPSQARAEQAGPLLFDPVRSVRVAAAQRILDIPTDSLSAEDREVVRQAIGEYRAALTAQADFPEVRLNVARYAEQIGRPSMARQSLQAALRLDPKLSEAWLRLARLDAGANRLAEARRTIENALGEVAEVPGTAPLHQLYGRVLAQQGDGEAAARAFETALLELPEELEVRIEYASLLTEIGRYGDALSTLTVVEGEQLADPQVLYLLAVNHARMKRRDTAQHYADELLRLHPRHVLNEHLQSALASSGERAGEKE